MTGSQAPEAGQKGRLDKWLWQARFFKTRGLASKLVSGGHVRVNSEKASKPAHLVAPGDVLTFPQARRIRVVRILEIGIRRGPALEAQSLYEDLSDPPTREKRPANPGYEGKGRPTKRERRKLDLNKPGALE